MTPPATFEHYLAAWNEQDPDEVVRLLEASVTNGVVFADPANKTVGLEALADLIMRTHREMPDASYHVTSGVDGGHDHVFRYSWEVQANGEVVIGGMDCTTTDTEGRITRIDGFFGPLPEAD